jgi:hypothetical protein
LANLVLIHRSAGSLWIEALEALDDKEKGDVNFKWEDKSAILGDVLKDVRKMTEVYLYRFWDYKGGKDINLRYKLEKVIEWVDRFKTFDIQDDLACAALPWEGVRFFLLVRPIISS